MAIDLKTPAQIALMSEGGHALARVLDAVIEATTPGMTTKSLDELAERLILQGGFLPAFKGYQGYRHTLCTSIDEEVVHVPPSDRILQDGQILSLDIGLIHQGWYLDMARTIAIGTISPDKQRLMKITEEAMYAGIDAIQAGKRLGRIGAAVQRHVEHAGLAVVRDLVGHGIGRHLHEEPQVPNYGSEERGPILTVGMVIAIEPMVNLGTDEVRMDQGKWPVLTADGQPSAHFEHTIAITEHGPVILTQV